MKNRKTDEMTVEQSGKTIPAKQPGTHPHAHVHDPKEKKRQLARISRIIGHLEYVKRMIEDDEDCSNVLMQLAASKSAMNGLERSIISEHLSHCIVHAIEDGDTSAVEEFTEAIRKYL